MDVGYGTFNIRDIENICHDGQDRGGVGDYRVTVVQLLLIF